MNAEVIINSWKNADVRDKVLNHPSGPAFSELEVNEMLKVCGGFEVTPQATPTLALTSALVSATPSAIGSYVVTRVLCK